MNTSVSLSSNEDFKPLRNGKKSVHKKFRLLFLIILIISAAFRISSKKQNESLVFKNDDYDVSPAFRFEPKREKITVSEGHQDDEKAVKIVENGGENNTVTNEKTIKSTFHFIINIATKKYHTKECIAVKKLAKDKRIDTDIEAESFQEAEKIIEAQGYDLCGLCGRKPEI